MKVIFYDDAPVFGGHEVMAVKAAALLSRAEDIEVLFVVWRGNAHLVSAIHRANSEGARISLCPVQHRARRLNVIWGLLDWTAIARTTRIMKREKADCVVVVQGRVETGVVGLLAGRLSKVDTVSYIPLAHTVNEMGGTAAWIRDWINWAYYKVPDRYITISESMKQRLLSRGIRNPISVVENFTEITRDGVQEGSRRQDSMRGRNRTRIGLLGRIEFRQKGQDWLVSMVRDNKKRFEMMQFVIVGDGPDRERLMQLIAEANVDAWFVLRGWETDPNKLFRDIDVVAIPSRFEGVPLVMLEALGRGIPVIGTDIDGMRDWLPRDWRFEFRNAAEFLKALDCALDADASLQLRAIGARINKVGDERRFWTEFRDGVAGNAH